MPDEILFAFVLAVFLCVVFSFVNGFHDTASAIATSIGSGALTIPAALVLAAFFNFIGAFVSHKVAFTVATGIVNPDYITAEVIIAAMFAAIAWNIVTWYYAAPSSSSHALISGLFGAAVMKIILENESMSHINWPELTKIITALFTSPLVGFIAGFFLFKFAIGFIFHLFPGISTHKPNRVFAKLQVVSAAFMSFSHGANDAQKTMGIIALMLMQAGFSDTLVIPFWVTALSAASISLGTLVGGWRIIKTVAKKITDLQPIHGFSAELGSASVIFIASMMGMPVSTTHIATSAVVGVGASKSAGKVQRGVVLIIVYAWIITIPVTIIGAGACYLAINFIGTEAFTAIMIFLFVVTFVITHRSRMSRLMADRS